MVAAHQYYYEVRRVSDVLAPAGANPPSAGAGGTGGTTGTSSIRGHKGKGRISTKQASTIVPLITPAPDWRIITDASAPAGPVTYFTVPTQETPTNGSASQPTTNINFTFNTTTGADSYQVQVFASTDPNGTGSPIFESNVVHPSGTQDNVTINGPFLTGTTYYWRVGAYASTDPQAPLNIMTGKSGFLYSSMYSFTTAGTPPPPPGPTPSSVRTPPKTRGPAVGTKMPGRIH
jgi:hypothetical protein